MLVEQEGGDAGVARICSAFAQTGMVWRLLRPPGVQGNNFRPWLLFLAQGCKSVPPSPGSCEVDANTASFGPARVTCAHCRA